MHFAFAMGGAGLVMYGAQKMCEKKIGGLGYKSCMKQQPAQGAAKDSVKKKCAPLDPGSDLLPKIMMYGGFGVIFAAFVFLSYLNGGLFGGGMGGMGGMMGGMGGMGQYGQY